MGVSQPILFKTQENFTINLETSNVANPMITFLTSYRNTITRTIRTGLKELI